MKSTNSSFGLIGMGRISDKHLNAIKTNKIDLKFICDLDYQKLLNFDNSNLIKTLNFEALLDYSDLVDAISICTDSGSHISIASKILANGFHCLIEKPVGLCLKEIDDLAVSARSNDLKVTICHQNRFNLAVQKLKDSIKDEKLGKLFYGVATIRWNRHQAYYDQADWRGKWRSDGGALMNQSIHNIDLLLWMMDSPVVEVFGYIDNKNHPSIEVEDMGVALLKFANGSFGIIESSMITYPENFEETLSIFGEKGSVVLGGKSVNKIVHWNVKDDPIDDLEKFNEEVDSVYGNGHIALYKDFIEAIEQDREPAITLQDGRNAVEVILAIYLSSFEKRPVQLPLPADTSTIMFEDFKFDK
jgi:UDP-N-acetyl-2-amino-2-deoxyglucuronate dehydrogenase